jgi:hypothetical protein
MPKMQHSRVSRMAIQLDVQASSSISDCAGWQQL